VRCGAVPVFKSCNANAVGIGGSQFLRQLHLGMPKIVVVDESADESNHNHGSGAASRRNYRLHGFFGRVSSLRQEPAEDQEQQRDTPGKDR